MGYGDNNTFYGWIVLGRTDLMTNYAYGNPLKALAIGNVTGTSTGASITYSTFNNASLSVSRLETGRYKITFPSSWFYNPKNCIVMATGLGYSYGALSSPIKATVTERTSDSFTVDTSDDHTRNDGSFMFIMFNMSDWH